MLHWKVIRSSYCGRYLIAFLILYADVAELADALDLGSSGRPCRFDSCHPQQVKKIETQYVLVFLFYFVIVIVLSEDCFETDVD